MLPVRGRAGASRPGPSSCPYSPNLVELDFSHLRAKGIGTLLIEMHQKRCSRCLPPDHGENRAFAPWSHFSQNEPSNNYRFFAGATFCVLLSRNDTQKVPRALVERLTGPVCCMAKWLKSSLERLFGKSG